MTSQSLQEPLQEEQFNRLSFLIIPQEPSKFDYLDNEEVVILHVTKRYLYLFRRCLEYLINIVSTYGLPYRCYHIYKTT